MFLNILCILFIKLFMMNVSKTFPVKPLLFSYFINVCKVFPVKPQFLKLVYKHLLIIINGCIENVYKTFFKHYNVNIYLETFCNPKDKV